MTLPPEYRSDAPKRSFVDFLTLAHSAGIIAIAGWLVIVSYNMGQDHRQISTNKESIDYINEHGSNGTDARLKNLERTMERIESKLEDILMEVKR